MEYPISVFINWTSPENWDFYRIFLSLLLYVVLYTFPILKFASFMFFIIKASK